MVRGVELADRLVKANLIGRDLGALLVVGAGAAGASAAIRAAQAGVPTLLVEKEPAPFRLQRHCRTRWIDPTQYDWPADSWPGGIYPYGGAACPLTWSADWSHHLAAQWQLMLANACNQMPRLVPCYSSVVRGWRLVGSTWEVELDSAPMPGQHGFPWRGKFGAIVWAVGFGSERCSVDNDYRGFAFWETDPFSLPNCGLPNGAIPRVLISGSGDGSLQDFLRIATTMKSAEEIYAALPLPRHFGRALYSAEDHAQRCYQWSSTERHEHTIHDELHRIYEGIVKDVWRSAGVVAGLDKIVRNPVPRTTLVHSCTHFAQAYGLNRFLTLLIARFLERRRGQRNVLLSESRVRQVAGSGHTCQGDPTVCHGKEHDVDIASAPDCREKKIGQDRLAMRANIIVIRHGIDSQLPPRVPDISHPRQLLPYRSYS